jgi:hypothetical protein
MRFLPTTNPANVFARAGLLFLGFALTWLCAAAGLFFLTAPPACTGSEAQGAQGQVFLVRMGVLQFQTDNGRCPATRDALVAEKYVVASEFVDPWGTSIAYWCTDDAVHARSAGGDRVFDTPDDITAEP